MNYLNFDQIYTFDDKYFYNKKLLPESLSINEYLKYKDDDNYLNNFNIIKRDEVSLDNIFLFIFNRGIKSGGNYYHFIFHYLQKIIGFFELKNLKLGIPLNMLDFQKELLYKLIPKENIIYLDIYRYNYVINNCYIGKYISASNLPLHLLNKYQNIFNFNNFESKNLIYIRRRNNNNAGKERIMINENDFINYLKDKNCSFFFFEDHNFNDKIINLIDLKPKTIIIEIGSGLTNLLFIPKYILKNIKFIIIDQDNWKLDKSRICNILNILQINFDIITCKNVTNNKDLFNSPFILNINDFSKFI